MTIHEFKRPRNAENILDFIDELRDSLEKQAPEERPQTLLVIPYSASEDGYALGIYIGGKMLTTVEFSGIFSVAKSRVEFNDNMAEPE